MTRWRRRAAAMALALGAYMALVRLLDRVGLIERLLSPSGAGAALALVAALAMYALRIGLIFVAPGVVVAWGVTAAIEAWRRDRPR